jgi:hypothetical protein
MAVYQIFRGDTRRLNHAVTRRDEDGVAQAENLAGASLLFTAKRNKSDTYAQAIIKKTTAVDEGITITDSAGGLAQTLILPEDTVGLTARTVLFYDLELQTALNEVETVEYGTIIVELDITDSTSPVGPPAAPPDPITPGVFLQHDGTSQVWSTWTLPEVAPLVGDINKVLTVTAAGVVTAQSPAAQLTAPANPADDDKYAIASGGDLVYLAKQAPLIISFGAVGVINGTGYMFPGGADSVSVQQSATSTQEYPMPFAGTVLGFYVIHNTPAGSSSVVYTAELDQIAQAMTATLASNSAGPTAGTTFSNPFAFTAGQRVRVSAQTTANVTNRPFVALAVRVALVNP